MNLPQPKLYSLKERPSKVELSAFSSPSLDFSSLIPSILKGQDLKQLVSLIKNAKNSAKTLLWGFGAHTIKVGLSPIIIRLMELGYINAIFTNGAFIIHDFEVAFQGKTSEDVAENLQKGLFGMAKETGEFINLAINRYSTKGYGEAIATYMHENTNILPYKEYSVVYNAKRLQVPVMVTVAIGNDIIHQHPQANGANIGEASMIDFKKLVSLLPTISKGGGVVVFGSSVLLPETFVKALNLARNLFGDVKDFFTAYFDMISHYRPKVNIVERPTIDSKYSGYYFVGHHEIMMPLLFYMILQ